VGVDGQEEAGDKERRRGGEGIGLEYSLPRRYPWILVLYSLCIPELQQLQYYVYTGIVLRHKGLEEDGEARKDDDDQGQYPVFDDYRHRGPRLFFCLYFIFLYYIILYYIFM
jgi:hypothetical protein